MMLYVRNPPPQKIEIDYPHLSWAGSLRSPSPKFIVISVIVVVVVVVVVDRFSTNTASIFYWNGIHH